MKRGRFCFSIFLIFLSVLAWQFHAQQKESVFVIPIKGTIDLGLSGFVERTIKEAKDNNAKAIILEINTFGGRVDAATQIRDAIFESGIQSIAFVNKRAISAGALITLAANSIVMAPGSTIGAATPVTFSPTGTTSPTGEKEISYVRKEFKATAEKNGHRTDLAEAMVDPDVEIKGIIQKGKLLTLTTQEAIKLKLASYQASNISEVIKIYGLKDAEIIEPGINWSENFVRFLTNPIISGLLLTIGFLGLYFELQAPGWGISGTLGVICLVLFLGGHFLVGLAQVTEIILFLAGTTLLLIEIFAIPGFGFVGISGIVFIILSIFLSLIKKPAPDVPVFKGDYIIALHTTVWSLVATFAVILLMFKFFPSTRIWKKLENIFTLKFKEESRLGYQVPSFDAEMFKGKSGTAITVLRPIGKIQIEDNIIDATTEGEYIEAGKKIKVVRVEGNRIIVSKEV